MPTKNLNRGGGLGSNRRRGVTDDRTANKTAKKLPPLKSNITQSTAAASNDILRSQYQRLSGKYSGSAAATAGKSSAKVDSSENELQLNLSTDTADSAANSRPAARQGGRRRGGIKLISSTYNNSSGGGSSGPTRRPSKLKTQQENDPLNSANDTSTLVKSKSRKKILKPRPPDKQINPTGEADTIESSQEQNTNKAQQHTTKPQWTNIVKKVQIHKHQTIKNKNKNLKKKDSFFKKPKSDFVIENTWIPRDPTLQNVSSAATPGNNSAGSNQKSSKKSKRKSSKDKTNKDSSCAVPYNKTDADTPAAETEEERGDDYIKRDDLEDEIRGKHVSSARVILDPTGLSSPTGDVHSAGRSRHETSDNNKGKSLPYGI